MINSSVQNQPTKIGSINVLVSPERQMRILKKQQIQITGLNQMISKTNFLSRQTKHNQAQQLLLKINNNNQSQPTSLGSNATGTSTHFGNEYANQSNQGGSSYLERIAVDKKQSSVSSSNTTQLVHARNQKENSPHEQENSMITSNRLIDNYFFHKKHFIETRKQQSNENQQQTEGNQNQNRHISNELIDTILSDLKHHFPQVAKIPSKQRRTNNKSFSPNAEISSVNTSPQQRILEKYIDSEIFVPKILHEESTLKAMVIDNKMRNSPVFVSEKGDDWQKRVQMQIAKQREYDQRIQKNIEQIELRLGLKKINYMDTVTKLMNKNATNSNIQLLEARVNPSINANNRLQSDTQDNDGSLNIMTSEQDRGSQNIALSVSPKISFQHAKLQININQDSVESLTNPIITQRSRQAAQGDFGNEQQLLARSINYQGKNRFKVQRKSIPDRLPSDLILIDKYLSFGNDEAKSPFNVAIPKFYFKPSIQIGQDNRSSSLDQSIQNSKNNNEGQQTFDQSYKDSNSKNNLFFTEQSNNLRSQVRALSTIDPSNKGNSLRQSMKKIVPNQKIKAVEGFFSPSKKQQQMPDKVQHIKNLLIEILKDETNPNPQEKSQKNFPPNFYKMLFQTNNNGVEFPTVIDKTQIKRVLTLINRWYHFKDPFDKNNETKMSVHLALDPRKTKRHEKSPFKRKNLGLDIDMTSGIFKRRAPSIDDSLYSEDDLSEIDEINLSDSEFASDEEDDFLFLNGDDDDEKMMVKIRAKINTKGSRAKLQFLIKCLNMILLQKSDPFLAKKHRNYLRMLRVKRKEEKEKTFYQRMQDDIKKREKNTQNSPLKNNNSSEWGLKMKYKKLGTNTSSGHIITNSSYSVDQQNSNSNLVYSAKNILNLGFNHSNYHTPVQSSNNVSAINRKETQRIKPFQYSIVMEEEDEDNTTRKNRFSSNRLLKYDLEKHKIE